MMPGTGALAAALQAATGRTPVNVGKGGDWLLTHLSSAYGLDPAHTLVVGDRLDTDIALGAAAGMRTLLPLTGVTSASQAIAAPLGMAPDYLAPSAAVLGGRRG